MPIKLPTPSSTPSEFIIDYLTGGDLEHLDPAKRARILPKIPDYFMLGGRLRKRFSGVDIRAASKVSDLRPPQMYDDSDDDGEESEVVKEVKRRRAEGDFAAGRGVESCIVSGDDGWELGLEEARQVSSVQVSVLSRYHNIIQLLATGVNLETKPRKRRALEEVAKQYFLSEEGIATFCPKTARPQVARVT
ncbi:hypothetical protein KI688_000734 [Linnemannia hyalina]|uniref:Uncharacterized protein n=1 Tax=Linnemannia hyalina TaxID=64524 RepID=A0A9P8BYX2_9FUNG|nr:hypothetical protein KI688_000734 [Linnemannia hyalina]